MNRVVEDILREKARRRAAAAPVTSQRNTPRKKPTGPLDLKEALRLTRVLQIPRINPLTKSRYFFDCRLWPEGIVPEGGRPPLTENQMCNMHPGHIVAYQEGGQAVVPID